MKLKERLQKKLDDIKEARENRLGKEGRRGDRDYAQEPAHNGGSFLVNSLGARYQGRTLFSRPAGRELHSPPSGKGFFSQPSRGSEIIAENREKQRGGEWDKHRFNNSSTNQREEIHQYQNQRGGEGEGEQHSLVDWSVSDEFSQKHQHQRGKGRGQNIREDSPARERQQAPSPLRERKQKQKLKQQPSKDQKGVSKKLALLKMELSKEQKEKLIALCPDPGIDIELLGMRVEYTLNEYQKVSRLDSFWSSERLSQSSTKNHIDTMLVPELSTLYEDIAIDVQKSVYNEKSRKRFFSKAPSERKEEAAVVSPEDESYINVSISHLILMYEGALDSMQKQLSDGNQQALIIDKAFRPLTTQMVFEFAHKHQERIRDHLDQEQKQKYPELVQSSSPLPKDEKFQEGMKKEERGEEEVEQDLQIIIQQQEEEEREEIILVLVKNQEQINDLNEIFLNDFVDEYYKLVSWRYTHRQKIFQLLKPRLEQFFIVYVSMLLPPSVLTYAKFKNTDTSFPEYTRKQTQQERIKTTLWGMASPIKNISSNSPTNKSSILSAVSSVKSFKKPRGAKLISALAALRSSGSSNTSSFSSEQQKEEDDKKQRQQQIITSFRQNKNNTTSFTTASTVETPTSKRTESIVLSFPKTADFDPVKQIDNMFESAGMKKVGMPEVVEIGGTDKKCNNEDKEEGNSKNSKSDSEKNLNDIDDSDEESVSESESGSESESDSEGEEQTEHYEPFPYNITTFNDRKNRVSDLENRTTGDSSSDLSPIIVVEEYVNFKKLAQVATQNVCMLFFDSLNLRATHKDQIISKLKPIIETSMDRLLFLCKDEAMRYQLEREKEKLRMMQVASANNGNSSTALSTAFNGNASMRLVANFAMIATQSLYIQYIDELLLRVKDEKEIFIETISPILNEARDRLGSLLSRDDSKRDTSKDDNDNSSDSDNSCRYNYGADDHNVATMEDWERDDDASTACSVIEFESSNNEQEEFLQEKEYSKKEVGSMNNSNMKLGEDIADDNGNDDDERMKMNDTNNINSNSSNVLVETVTTDSEILFPSSRYSPEIAQSELSQQKATNKPVPLQKKATNKLVPLFPKETEKDSTFNGSTNPFEDSTFKGSTNPFELSQSELSQQKSTNKPIPLQKKATNKLVPLFPKETEKESTLNGSTNPFELSQSELLQQKATNEPVPFKKKATNKLVPLFPKETEKGSTFSGSRPERRKREVL